MPRPFQRRRISRRLRIFLNEKGVQEQSLQPRLLLVCSDQERFERVVDHTIGLLKRDGDSELKNALRGMGDDDTDPEPGILARLIQFFIDHWQEILALILSFFKVPGNNDSLELSEASVASMQVCDVPEEWEEKTQATRNDADEILRRKRRDNGEGGE